MAIFAPYDHSYDRIRRADASPSNANWGIDDRMVAFRVPRSSAANRRIENRLPGGDANPYLTAAITLGLGLYGMQTGLQPLDVGPVLPVTLGTALDALQADAVVRDILGTHLVDLYVAIKRQESADRNAAENPRHQWDIPYLLEQS
jgi:glutamine synthetase